MRLRDLTAARRYREDPEKGQATTEFALILIPLLILVVGVIQFGIALNFWLDMNRISNQGARWAIVNAWPNCPRTYASQCTGGTLGSGNSLKTYLRYEAMSQGLRNNVNVAVCFPDDGDGSTDPGDPGSPVRVQLDSPYTFRAIMQLGTINLRARTTMRIENNVPDHHGTLSPCPA